MKRLLFYFIAVLGCGLAIYTLGYNRPLLPDLTPDEEAVPAEQTTRVRVALSDWTENLEVKNAISHYNKTNPDQIEIVPMNLATDAYDDTLNMLMTSGRGRMCSVSITPGWPHM